MYLQLKIVLGVSLLLTFSCEETPPKAVYSFQIEATSLTIEPILSQKVTQSNTSFDWSNVVYENEDGYYGSDSAEAGQYTFIISSKYMRTYNDTVAVDTTVTKILNMEEGKSYTIIGYPSYGEYNWTVTKY